MLGKLWSGTHCLFLQYSVTPVQADWNLVTLNKPGEIGPHVWEHHDNVSVLATSQENLYSVFSDLVRLGSACSATETG